jgi:hypothetical protein
MSHVKFVLLLFISANLYSQDLIKRIEGQWICASISDSKGDIPLDQFNDSGYLKYHFHGRKVTVSDTPFNPGSTFDAVFNSANLVVLSSDQIEKKSTYEVNIIDENNLALAAMEENGGVVTFIFHKQNLPSLQSTIDNGVITIEHFKKSKDAKVSMRSALYKASASKADEADARFFDPSPTFNSKDGGFEFFISDHFSFPKSYELNTFSNELVVEFDVVPGGIDNITIVRGLSDEIDNSIKTSIAKSSNKWQALEIDGNPIKTRLRFHVVFLLGLVDIESQK